jgi:methyl-accepting chemotaxis protein
MISLSSLRLGPRLAVGFGSLVLLCAGVVGLGIDRIATMRSVSVQLGTTEAEKLSLAEQWGRSIESNTARTWVVFFASDEQVKQRVRAEMLETNKGTTERLTRLKEIADSVEDKRLLEDISTQRDAFQSLRNGLLKRKVLFGSDFPFITPDRWLADFAKLEIKDEVRPLILKDNALRVLGLA